MARGVGGEGGAVGGRDRNAGGSGGGGGQGGRDGRGGGSFGDKFGIGDFGRGSRGVGGEGGARGGRDPNAGGGARGGGGRGGGSFGDVRGAGPQGRANPNQSRSASTPGGAAGSGQGGAGGTSFGNSTTADYGMAKKYGVSPDRYSQEAADYRDRLNDAYNTDNTGTESLGNLIAGFLGFNEQPPEKIGFDPQNPTGPRANWGFDPAGLVGGTLGNAFGVPIVGGFLADQISSALGRPLEVNLGPSVFGNPATGETTVTGPNTTVRDKDNRDGTFLGSPPLLAGIGGGVSHVAPSRSTLYGTDPSAPETPAAPPAPAPELPDGLSPINPPSGVNVDPGNTGLSPTDLAGIFQQYGQKVYKGKNRSQVVT